MFLCFLFSLLKHSNPSSPFRAFRTFRSLPSPDCSPVFLYFLFSCLAVSLVVPGCSSETALSARAGCDIVQMEEMTTQEG